MYAKKNGTSSKKERKTKIRDNNLKESKVLYIWDNAKENYLETSSERLGTMPSWFFQMLKNG